MRADQAAELFRDLELHDIEVWLVGGWGMDALLARQTRDHHELDALVELSARRTARLRCSGQPLMH